jgi:hypothetical protein
MKNWTCDKDVGEKKCIQNFGRDAFWKTVTLTNKKEVENGGEG